MIRYLSCVHNNAERYLTAQELASYKSGLGLIVTECGVTRYEDTQIKFVYDDGFKRIDGSRPNGGE